jgi:glycosyltransferase involved in cell wall biosynthesis
MRVVILSDRIPPENRGGAGKVAWALAGGLRATGHDVHLIAATTGAPFEQVREGIPTYHLHSSYPERWRGWLALYNPQTVGQIRRLLEQLRPDVVNAHNIHAELSYSCLTVAHHMGIATVFNSHDVMPFAYNKPKHFIDPARCGVASPDDYRLPRFYNLKQMRFRYNPFRNIVIRYVLRHYADARVCVSEAHRQALEANGLPPFQVVYNGIDPHSLDALDEAVDRVRDRLGLAGRRVILFAGRLTRDKGSVQLLRALGQVIAHVPEALLLVLSSSALNIPEAEFDGVRPYVRSGGWLEGADLAAAFHLADVVAVPSIIMDSFPTVNLEAMAAGKPLIATCYGGSPEAVIDGETGYIVNPFDTPAFADRLERLLLDANLRQRMGAAGRRRLVEHFTLAAQVEQMMKIYGMVSRRVV